MSNTGSLNPSAEDVALPSAARVAADDMRDRPEDWPLLAPWVAECGRIVGPVYEKANAAALVHQRKHRLLTKIAATSGTIAVVLVILELICMVAGLDTSDKVLGAFEVVAALAALLAVVLGLVASQLDNWLVERHKAERCRLMKFGFLIDPALWRADQQRTSDRARQLRDEAAGVEAVRTIEEPRRWLGEVHRPAFLTELTDCRADEPVLRQLIAYYRATRLRVQIAYLDERIKRFALRDRITRVLPEWLFFFSVFAAFVHFALRLWNGPHPLGAPLDAALVAVLFPALVAAILPVLGAGIRTYRMANEFGRNVRRFESTLHVLREIDRLLEGVDAKRGFRTDVGVLHRPMTEEGMDAKTVFLTLWTCEHTLEIEHREWLRLMAETEWFG